MNMTYDKAMSMSLLSDMVRIRRMEEKAAELYSAAKIRGFLHLYIGQEAVAVGALRAISPEDNVVATYREHGHALIKGISMKAIMAEMFGKQEGCSHGRGGSMHLIDRESRFFGGTAIVASGIPMAVGVALADKMNALPRVTACFFGDGAMAEGAFHESMNLASLWQLPVLFLCENNFYAMGTALDRYESQTDLCVKAASYKMPAVRVDGMDVISVHEAIKLAMSHVRAGAGPYFVELQTYRFRPHSMYDPDLYRERGEIDEWKKRDPIQLFVDRLKQESKLTGTEYAAIVAQADLEVQQAIDFAEAGTLEPVENLLKDVHTPEPLR